MPLIITEAQNIAVDERHSAVLVRYTEENPDNTVAAIIADNTEQTWQPDRERPETLANTVQGKISEEILQTYLKRYHPEINVLSYDEIRNDRFKKHSPFDHLVWVGERDIGSVTASVRNDITNTVGRYVSLSAETISLCRRENVKIIEVKSTQITYRHKSKCSFVRGGYRDIAQTAKLADIILGDDFLAYPHLCRSSLQHSFSEADYISLLRSRGINVSGVGEMLQYERANQTADAFVRVYIDEGERVGLIMGWIDRDSFYTAPVLKKMWQRGKSELAVYFAVSLRRGYNIDSFRELFGS